ncbi:Vms1/Ankzf1 family peptidyl-tRNA hydrolase [Streptomyces yaanensis]|uniref:Vms1/Ankzf1 family peptidyl-tRNA hydrolase n=1 Tax=Streptomyces yaanensis TaxID=1142239 RepID=A0ABV7SD63_9ACTN|nr:Vms1/Ankzf1 family peptidyl-tRNA hydrolase [Streptomyces sp. CGMCC 4.7035]WNB98900.1 Vms1/Ankzf1 family peptidyl-tRNA hydrolase [Streptomyces sp. CGMCC 4.7035]
MDLAFLHPLYEHPGPWASVYVDTSRHTQTTSRERSLTAQALSQELAGQGADEPTCRAVRTAVEELAHSPEPLGRALFARAGAVVLDPPLAAAPPGSSAHWSPLPHTAPLLELASEDPVCVVAYIDRKGAAFELRGALGSGDAGAAPGKQWPPHRTSTGDWSVRHFQLRVENIWEHNAAEIADALAVCQEETGADLVVLVGEEGRRYAVRERLPQRLHDRVAEAPHDMGSRLLDEDVERIRAEHAHRRAVEELERFLAARAPDEEGRTGAVEGVPAVVEAAREHRIDELLIRPDGPDTRREVWIGEDPDQVAVRRTDLMALGERHIRSARADDALLRSAVETGAEAVSVTVATAQEVPVGGVGALLRWT